MCIGGSKPADPTPPAAAPAPALEPAKVPEIGETRRKESLEAFGEEAPNYRVNRHKAKSVNPDGQIVM